MKKIETAQELLSEYSRKCYTAMEAMEVAQKNENIRHEKKLKQIQDEYWKQKRAIETWYNITEARQPEIK